MESQDIVLTKFQNHGLLGYGLTMHLINNVFDRLRRRVWCEFYQMPNYSYTDAIERESPKSLFSNASYVWYNESKDKIVLFNNVAFARRTALLAELALLEAERRAALAGRPAFLNLIGAGNCSCWPSWRCSRPSGAPRSPAGPPSSTSSAQVTAAAGAAGRAGAARGRAARRARRPARLPQPHRRR
ncbi:hypothetical protein ACJJTC_017648 [Scirpophaga incertulas]